MAESGSFTAAASALNLSQSAVSRQVQQLESYFGCTLFERHTRKVLITEQGRALLPIIGNILSSIKNSFEMAGRHVSNITVRMAPTFARKWFLPRLPKLYQAYPNLNVNIDTAWFVRPTFTLGDVDLIITYGNGHWPGMEVLPLLEERLTPLCSPLFLQQLGKELTLSCLSEVVLLHSNPRHSDWVLWLQAEGVYSFGTQRNQVFDTQDFAITAAASGYGVVMGDINFALQELEQGLLVTPFRRVIESGYGYYAIYPPSSERKAGVGDFVAWLKSSR